MLRAWQAHFNIPTTALAFAVLVHGLASSPAPPGMNWAEILIAIGLVIAATPSLQHWLKPQDYAEEPARILWLYLFILPLLIGLMAGHDARDWSRDIIALCFLSLPLWLDKKINIQGLAWVMAAAGAAMGARYWYISGATESGLRALKNGDGLLYLALDPLVLFAAIFLPIQIMLVRGHWRWALRAACFMGALFWWGALAGMKMRGAVMLGLAALSFYALAQKDRRITIIMALCALGVMVGFWQSLEEIFSAMLAKTQSVGLNARDADWQAIWDIQAADPAHFIFGQGWGKVYASPAVGNYFVNYAHSAAGYFFLKTGLLGGVATTLYIWCLRPRRWRMNAITIAVIPPIILAFTLYTSYKFLGLGLVLTLLHFHDKKLDHS